MDWENELIKHFKKKKVGLALGSGGAKGLSHIGVIKFLEEMGVKIDFITGSSIGALIGGAYASGLSIEEIEDIALETDLTSTAKLFSPGFGKSGLVTVEAIRASISIPIVFQPVICNNIVLVDGGLVNPVPINIAREMGADYIIAVNILSSKNKSDPKSDKKFNNKIDLEKPLEIIPVLERKLENLMIDHKWIRNFIKHKEKEDLPGMKKIFYQSVQIAQERLIELSVELYKPDVLIEPEVENFSMFDFYKAKEIIKKGYIAAEAFIKEY